MFMLGILNLASLDNPLPSVHSSSSWRCYCISELLSLMKVPPSTRTLIKLLKCELCFYRSGKRVWCESYNSIRKLYYYDVRGITSNWFKSFLQDRYQYTNINPLSPHPRNWSNTPKQFVGFCRRLKNFLPWRCTRFSPRAIAITTV